VLDKFDCHQATQLKHVRDDFRLNRRRNNYARVLQAYADEEAEKLLAADNRALSRAHQRLNYFERVSQVERFRMGQGKATQRSSSLPRQFGEASPRDASPSQGDALDEFASKSMTLQSVGSVGSQPSPRSESQRSSQHSQSSQRTTGSRSRMAELVQGSASPFPGDSTRLQSTVGPSPMAALIG